MTGANLAIIPMVSIALFAIAVWIIAVRQDRKEAKQHPK